MLGKSKKVNAKYLLNTKHFKHNYHLKVIRIGLSTVLNVECNWHTTNHDWYVPISPSKATGPNALNVDNMQPNHVAWLPNSKGSISHLLGTNTHNGYVLKLEMEDFLIGLESLIWSNGHNSVWKLKWPQHGYVPSKGPKDMSKAEYVSLGKIFPIMLWLCRTKFSRA